MKSLPVLALAATLSLLSVGAGFAATASPSAAEEATWEQQALDHRLAYLTDKLDLTNDQQAKLKPILQKEIAKESRLHQKTRCEIEDLLTPAQKTTLENLPRHHSHG